MVVLVGKDMKKFLYCQKCQKVTIIEEYTGGHPEAENAINGIVKPVNVNSQISPETHNLGGFYGDSPFTSWTTSIDKAKEFAGKDGIILRVTQGAPKPNDTWNWEFSIDEYMEYEILLKGIRTGDMEVYRAL